MLFHQSDTLTVYNADVIGALHALEPGSIDSVVTSPPYAMQRKSTYGGVPEVDYPEWTVEWMRALKPALTERGSVMINISPHVRGGVLSDYVLRMRLALRVDGWFEHDELAWVKPNAFPTGDTSRPTRAWESAIWVSLTPRPFVDAKRSGGPSVHAPGFHRAKDWSNIGSVVNSIPDRVRCKNFLSLGVGSGSDRRFVHPAPFPVKLADWLMKINTPDGGTVLDPFAGSGTTAVAAHSNGFKSVAIERDPEYAQMIVDRYKATTERSQES